MKKKAIILTGILILIIIFSYLFFIFSSESLEKECSIDSDCVPATCCHATQCVAKIKEPDCSRSFCTLQCAPGTLDCGGNCICEKGRCQAQVS